MPAPLIVVRVESSQLDRDDPRADAAVDEGGRGAQAVPMAEPPEPEPMQAPPGELKFD